MTRGALFMLEDILCRLEEGSCEGKEQESLEAFNILMQLIREKSKQNIVKYNQDRFFKYSFPIELLYQIYERILKSSNENHLDILITKAANKYLDIKYYTWILLKRFINNPGSNNSNSMTTVTHARLFNIAIKIKFPLEDCQDRLTEHPEIDHEKTLENDAIGNQKETVDNNNDNIADSHRERNQEIKIIEWKNEKYHKEAFSEFWISFLKHLPSNLHHPVLAILDTHIFPYFTRASLLSDFLIQSFQSTNKTTAILAQSGLFHLVHRCKLNYDQIYPRLYQLLDIDCFYLSPRFKKKFFNLLNLFMTLTMVPAYLVAAFVKKIMRLALQAPPSGCLWAMGFAYNMIKGEWGKNGREQEWKSTTMRGMKESDHGSILRILIDNESKKNIKSFKNDPFDIEERDYNKCKAMESSLWEIEALIKHTCPKVSKMATIFKDKLTKQPFKLNLFFNTENDYLDMIKEELKHRWSKRPPLALDISKNVFK